MARLPRIDRPGHWHHVMNRGLARRTVFETDQDVRYFLSRLARVVRAGMIEVHAYSLLTTHYHLLVRSPEGSLSEAMRVVQNGYVRWFNRGRQRDGALFRGRFQSKTVDSLSYRENLVRYIDFNPVVAGIVSAPGLHPHGSARWYAMARDRPPWLARDWIEATVIQVANSTRYEPRHYAECFGRPLNARMARVFERRLTAHALAADPLDDLLGAAPDRVLEWMRRKALVADGTEIGLPVCDGEIVSELIAAERMAQPDWRISSSRKSVDAWSLIEVALLRDLCAATWREAGVRLAATAVGAAQSYRRHQQALEEDGHYAEAVARVVGSAMQTCYGSRR